MAYHVFQWTEMIVGHLAEHGISQDDFEFVVCNPTSKGDSRSSGLPARWGYAPDGRYIVAVYEELDELTVRAKVTSHFSRPHRGFARWSA